MSHQLSHSTNDPKHKEGEVSVLVVGDVPELTESGLVSVLGKRVHIMGVSSISEALGEFEQGNCDVMVIATTLCAQDTLLLSNAETSGGLNVPLIVITPQSDAVAQIDALKVRVDDVILRPIQPDILVSRIRNVMSRYRARRINLALIDRLESYISRAGIQQAISPGATEEITATVLFSDLRGFTAASFAHDPSEVFGFVNTVLTVQMEHVRAEGGYVDGFSGDGLLALFEGDEDCTNACRAGKRILTWAAETTIGPWTSCLPVGLGIHRGTVVRGDLGNDHRRVYTVLGTAVNVTARLCGVAQAGEAVVSDDVVARAKESAFNASRRVDIRGLPHPIEIHSLLY